MKQVKEWIDGNESAKEMLSRVLTENPLLRLSPLNTLPLRIGNVLELLGPSPSAKTHILIQVFFSIFWDFICFVFGNSFYWYVMGRLLLIAFFQKSGMVWSMEDWVGLWCSLTWIVVSIFYASLKCSRIGFLKLLVRYIIIAILFPLIYSNVVCCLINEFCTRSLGCANVLIILI